jgi:hypothetical protein
MQEILMIKIAIVVLVAASMFFSSPNTYDDKVMNKLEDVSATISVSNFEMSTTGYMNVGTFIICTPKNYSIDVINEIAKMLCEDPAQIIDGLIVDGVAAKLGRPADSLVVTHGMHDEFTLLSQEIVGYTSSHYVLKCACVVSAAGRPGSVVVVRMRTGPIRFKHSVCGNGGEFPMCLVLSVCGNEWRGPTATVGSKELATPR